MINILTHLLADNVGLTLLEVGAALNAATTATAATLRAASDHADRAAAELAAADEAQREAAAAV